MVDANDNEDNYMRHIIGHTAEKYISKAIGKY